MKVTYRPAAPEDFEFLYRLHRETMSAYVAATWGQWNEGEQRQQFQHNFDPALLRILQYEGQDAGVVWVQERAEEIFLVNLQVLPAYAGHGIGTRVIEDLLSEANRQGKPVALQVLKVNLRARALYQRLGFGVTGENDTHYIMANENARRVKR